MKEEPGEPTGRENKELDISESDHHEICDTNTERANWIGKNGESWDQG